MALGGSTNGRRDPVAYRNAAELLIARGVEVNLHVTWGGQGPARTALDEALRHGNVAVAEALRRSGGTQADGQPASDERFRTAYLRYATAVREQNDNGCLERSVTEILPEE